MKTLVTLILLLSLSSAFADEPASPPPPAANPEAEKAAMKAAEEWLALVDAEKYEESWDAAASLFKDAIVKKDWPKALIMSRKLFGKFVARKFKSAEYKTALPGAPDGEYVVIQFETAFEKKKESIETVTPMKDKDGKWRVSGYFIK